MVKKFNLSPEQDAAANPTDNVWVQANAGTGKTSVLVQRLLRIFFRTPDITDCGVLCLTYTKAAAGEMRNRILRELQKWAMATDDELVDLLDGVAMNKPATSDDIARARGIFFTYIDNPDLLKIKTIHSFCEEILRQFPTEAGISPAWSMVSDDAQRILLQDAFSRLINKSNNARTRDAFVHIVERIDENSLGKLLGILSNHYKDFFQITDIVKYREYFVDTITEFLKLNTPIQTDISTEHLQKIILDTQNCINASKTPGKTLINIVNTTKQYIDNTIDFEEYANAYLKSDKTPNSTVAKSLAKAGALMAIDEQKRLSEIYQQRFAVEIFDDTMALFDLSAEFANIYKSIKNERNLLDFEDLILYTRKLFSSPDVMGWVLSQLNVRLTHILVDEAQDTSPDQWDVLRMLTSDFFTDGDTSDNPHSLFVVGDTKQSIYAFQGADPRAFDATRANIAEQIKQNMRTLHEIPLTQSFRSMPPILYTVDAFFGDDTIREKTGFINNTHKYVKNDPDAFVELHELMGNGGIDMDGDEYISTIADNIQSVLNEGKFTPGDIMVLVQNREPMSPKLVKELKRRNIPVAGSDRIKLPDFPAIRDLLNLVRFCISTADDYSLCCVLKSPIFRLSERDIFNICKIRNDENNTKKRQSEQYTPTTVFDILTTTNPDIRSRLESIINWSNTMSPYSFFTNVLNTNDTRKNMIAALGEQIIDPLEEFLTICLAYERTQSGTMRDFIKWFITGGSVIKRDMDAAPGVRIVTIHSSKGLEAPVIFLIDTVRTPKIENVFRITPELQSAKTRARDNGLPTPWLWFPRQNKSADAYQIAASSRARAQTAEHYRLLYVAMTRAINRLYIYGYATRNNNATDLTWYYELWRVLSNDKYAQKIDNGIRIQNVK